MTQGCNVTALPLPAGSGGFRLAEVLEVVDGAATALQDPETGGTAAVAGHLQSVGPLRPGQRVLVASTAQGAVIVGRVRDAAEPPAAVITASEGRVAIRAEDAAVIEAGRSRIEVRADGVVRVDGAELHHFAERQLRLFSPSIEVN